MEEKNLITELTKDMRVLKRQNKLLFLGMLLLLVGSFLFSFTENPQEKFDSVRAKNLIIEDELGGDRIIIAPNFANTKDRKRKDTLGGILILDEKGYDQVLFGHARTAQWKGKIFKRRGTAIPYGFYINDSIGEERGGITYYNDRGLATVGLDNGSGEGIHLIATENGFNEFLTRVLVQKK